MKKPILAELINALIILLFVYSGGAKLIDFPAFHRAMHNQPIPAWFADILIYSIPPLELGIAISLMFVRSRRTGLYAFLIVMTIFTVYIGCIILNVFPRVSCSCGELIRSLTWSQHFWFNAVYMVLAIMAIRLEQERKFHFEEFPD